MSFDQATAVLQKDANTYTADFKEDWCIGSVPHGGYVTATFLRAVKKHFDTSLSKQKQPHTLALHLDFLRRTQTGPATFTVKNVKLGRQTSVVHVTLTQGGREEVVGYITQSNLHTEKGISFATKWQASPPRIPLTSTLADLEAGRDPAWGEKREWPSPEFRKATQKIRSWFPRNGQPQMNTYDMWICFKDPESRWTNESLGFLVDTFPQISETFVLEGFDQYDPKLDEQYSREDLRALLKSKTPAFWYPTLLLNLEVKKALPEEGVKFLGTRLQTKSIANGRYDLEVVVWDERGDIVALSHHVVLALGSERNLAKRRTGVAEGKL